MAKLHCSHASMNAAQSTTLLHTDFNYCRRRMRTLLFATGAQD